MNKLQYFLVTTQTITDVGRSCILVSMGGRNIMLDCGMHMGFNDEVSHGFVHSLIYLFIIYSFCLFIHCLWENKHWKWNKRPMSVIMWVWWAQMTSEQYTHSISPCCINLSAALHARQGVSEGQAVYLIQPLIFGAYCMVYEGCWGLCREEHSCSFVHLYKLLV